MQRIKKGDTVEVIAGKDAAEARRNGRTVRGTVNRVVPGYKIDRTRRKVGRDPEKDRVVIQGVNILSLIHISEPTRPY